MDTGAALMRAIIDEPDDDVHRLVFADWLEENGLGKWASLIRAQLTLHPLVETRGNRDPFVDRWLVPLRDLTWPVRREMVSALAEIVEAEESSENPPEAMQFRWKVRRGMIEYVELWGDGVTRFIEKVETIFQRVPLVDVVLRTMIRPGAEFRPIVRNPHNNHRSIDRSTFDRFLDRCDLSRLRNLDLRGVEMHNRLDSLTRRATRLGKCVVWVSEEAFTDHRAYPAAKARVQAALGDRLVVRPADYTNWCDEYIPF